jgi:hypothetical protein
VSFKIEEPQKITDGIYKMAMANFFSMPGNNSLNRRNSLKIPPYDSQANINPVVKKLFPDSQTKRLQRRTIVKL